MHASFILTYASFPFSFPHRQYRYRMDDNNSDRFSDSDSLSFNSLSRSSSLIQFESLERQLLAEGQSFGGSTPSINNTLDTNNTNEQNDTTNSVRCYYDLNKLNFSNTLFMKSNQEPDSSEPSSSDNSIFSDGRENCTNAKDRNESAHEADDELNRKNKTNTKNLTRNKNSTENLSEDSGYCEFPSIKSRSKSNPNLKQQNVIEQHANENHKSLNNLSYCQNNIGNNNKNASHPTNLNMHLRLNSQNDTKIDTTTSHPSALHPTVFDNKNRFREIKTNGNGTTTAANISSTISEKSTVPSSSSSVAASAVQLQNIISASLPDILNHSDYFGEQNYCDLKNNSLTVGDVSSQHSNIYEKDDFCIVSSVPSNLNFYSNSENSDEHCTDETSLNERGEPNELDFSWNLNYNGNSINNRHQRSIASVASKNFDLGTYVIPTTTEVKSSLQQRIINSSYSNLTILDYSGNLNSARSPVNGSLKTMAANKSNRNSTSSREFSKCNFLLDEISAHFDRNLSILNDKDENSDLLDMLVENKAIPVGPPQPPPRRHSLQKQLSTENKDILSATDGCSNRASTSTASPTPSDLEVDDEDVKNKYTFDRDPTNLKTCYAESLEQCNFDLNSSTNSVNSDKQLPFDSIFNKNKQSPVGKREFIASTSTPNLYSEKNEVSNEDDSDFLQTSSIHNSMNQIPQSPTGEKSKGILSVGSRNSLGKGVSFYPYVSEISWRENSMDESGDYSETDLR